MQLRWCFLLFTFVVAQQQPPTLSAASFAFASDDSVTLTFVGSNLFLQQNNASIRWNVVKVGDNVEEPCIVGQNSDLLLECLDIDERYFARHTTNVSLIVNGTASEQWMTIKGLMPKHCVMEEDAPADTALCVTKATSQTRVNTFVSPPLTVTFSNVQQASSRGWTTVGGRATMVYPYTAYAVGIWRSDESIVVQLTEANALWDWSQIILRTSAPLGWLRIGLVYHNDSAASLYVDGALAAQNTSIVAPQSVRIAPQFSAPYGLRKHLISNFFVANESLSVDQIAEYSLPNSSYQWVEQHRMRPCTGSDLLTDPSPLFNSITNAYFVCKKSVKPVISAAYFYSFPNGTVALHVDGRRLGLSESETRVLLNSSTQCVVVDRTSTRIECDQVPSSIFIQEASALAIQVDDVWSSKVSVDGMSFDHCRLDDNAPVNGALCLTSLSVGLSRYAPYEVTAPFTVAFWIYLSANTVAPSHSTLFDYVGGAHSVRVVFDRNRHVQLFVLDESGVWDATAPRVFTSPLRVWPDWVHFTLSNNGTFSVTMTHGNGSVVTIDELLHDDRSLFSRFCPRLGGLWRGTQSTAALLGDLRIANESMTAQQALDRSQPNSTYRWTHHFPMQACSGENLTADPSPLFEHVRRAMFVCKPGVVPITRDRWMTSSTNGAGSSTHSTSIASLGSTSSTGSNSRSNSVLSTTMSSTLTTPTPSSLTSKPLPTTRLVDAFEPAPFDWAILGYICVAVSGAVIGGLVVVAFLYARRSTEAKNDIALQSGPTLQNDNMESARFDASADSSQQYQLVPKAIDSPHQPLPVNASAPSSAHYASTAEFGEIERAMDQYRQLKEVHEGRQ